MAIKNYQSGDYNIDVLSIVSPRVNLDVSSIYTTISTYESIFTPGTVCDIEVFDTRDLLGTFRLYGDETLVVKISIPGTVTMDFRFAIYELSELEFTGAQKGKKYKLKCVSEEAMYAKTNYVQKSYNQLCSEMISDIHKIYLKSQKPLIVEQTKTPQKIVVPHMNPYKAIEMIRKRSVSVENKSPLYVFFENRINEIQTFNFVTIEKLFTGAIAKKFQQSALNIDYKAREDDNIIAYKIPTQFKSIENIQHGGPRKITTFNFTTWEFESTIVKPKPTEYDTGGDVSNITPIFENKYFNPKIPPQSIIPVDISQRPKTNIPEHTADLQVYLATLMQNTMKIRVPGDTLLTAGQMIRCVIPNKRGDADTVNEDPMITGDFLISRIHHKMGEFGERPRYTCIIECIKGTYES